MQQTSNTQNASQQAPNGVSENLIAMNITLEHATILSWALEQVMAKGIDEVSLDGQTGTKGPIVGAYVCEMYAKLNMAIQSTVAQMNAAQQQQAQAQGMTGGPWMFGAGQMPNAVPQPQPQQVNPVTPQQQMPAGFPEPTNLSSPGVEQVPLPGSPYQQGGSMNQAPTLMPQPNQNQDQNQNASAGANGAAGSPIITKP